MDVRSSVSALIIRAKLARDDKGMEDEVNNYHFLAIARL